MITVHQLMFGFDRASNSLVFGGKLENGYEFAVAFPIGHVVVTFDRQAAALGYAGAPMCGAVDTIDSFIDAVEVIHKKTGGMNDVELGWMAELGSPIDRVRAMQNELQKLAASGASKEQIRARAEELKRGILPGGGFFSNPVTSVASKAFNATIKKVGQQAIKVARKGVSYVGKAGTAIARSKLVGTALAGAAVAFPAVGAPALAAWGAANRAVNAYDAARQGVKGAVQTYNAVKKNATALATSSHPAARMAIAGLSSYRV